MADDSAAQKPPAGGIKTFSCPSCGGTVGIRAVGATITAVCQSCGSLIDVANDNYRIIKEAAVKVRKSLIPLGTRAFLFGAEWEAIGYSVKCDDTGVYEWREYLLFNPYQGFRFLVEADGHWNFVKSLRQNIEGGGTTHNAWFDDRDYRIYVRGGAVVEYVMGEFYWRVKVGEKTAVVDYIAPPYILSMEQSDEDIIWSQGVYVNAEVIWNAFNVYPITGPKGISPNQPSPYTGKKKGIMGLALIFFIALWFIQITAVGSAANKTVYQRAVQVPPAYKGQLLIADPIDIPGEGNVAVWASSPVSNSWVELDISLVSDATQESDNLILPIEYYHGSDSDGAWSEGGQSSAAFISSVPSGKYHLQIEPDASAFGQSQPVDIDVRVIRDVPVWENFWITLLLLMAYPFWVMIRTWYFESQRWANSDFAPAMYRKGGDE